jgi:hypothetical protein
MMKEPHVTAMRPNGRGTQPLTSTGERAFFWFGVPPSFFRLEAAGKRADWTSMSPSATKQNEQQNQVVPAAL